MNKANTSIRYLQFIINEAEEALGYATDKTPRVKHAFQDSQDSAKLKRIFEQLNDLNESIGSRL